MDSWGQAVIGLWLGLGSSEEPNFFPMLTYFQNKIQPGMDVIDERKLCCTVPLVQHGDLGEPWTTEVLWCQ